MKGRSSRQEQEKEIIGQLSFDSYQLSFGSDSRCAVPFKPILKNEN